MFPDWFLITGALIWSPLDGPDVLEVRSLGELDSIGIRRQIEKRFFSDTSVLDIVEGTSDLPRSPMPQPLLTPIEPMLHGLLR